MSCSADRMTAALPLVRSAPAAAQPSLPISTTTGAVAAAAACHAPNAGFQRWLSLQDCDGDRATSSTMAATAASASPPLSLIRHGAERALLLRLQALGEQLDRSIDALAAELEVGRILQAHSRIVQAAARASTGAFSHSHRTAPIDGSAAAGASAAAVAASSNPVAAALPSHTARLSTQLANFCGALDALRSGTEADVAEVAHSIPRAADSPSTTPSARDAGFASRLLASAHVNRLLSAELLAAASAGGGTEATVTAAEATASSVARPASPSTKSESALHVLSSQKLRVAEAEERLARRVRALLRGKLTLDREATRAEFFAAQQQRSTAVPSPVSADPISAANMSREPPAAIPYAPVGVQTPSAKDASAGTCPAPQSLATSPVAAPSAAVAAESSPQRAVASHATVAVAAKGKSPQSAPSSGTRSQEQVAFFRALLPAAPAPAPALAPAPADVFVPSIASQLAEAARTDDATMRSEPADEHQSSSSLLGASLFSSQSEAAAPAAHDPVPGAVADATGIGAFASPAIHPVSPTLSSSQHSAHSDVLAPPQDAAESGAGAPTPVSDGFALLLTPQRNSAIGACATPASATGLVKLLPPPQPFAPFSPSPGSSGEGVAAAGPALVASPLGLVALLPTTPQQASLTLSSTNDSSCRMHVDEEHRPHVQNAGHGTQHFSQNGLEGSEAAPAAAAAAMSRTPPSSQLDDSRQPSDLLGATCLGLASPLARDPAPLAAVPAERSGSAEHSPSHPPQAPDSPLQLLPVAAAPDGVSSADQSLSLQLSTPPLHPHCAADAAAQLARADSASPAAPVVAPPAAGAVAIVSGFPVAAAPSPSHTALRAPPDPASGEGEEGAGWMLDAPESLQQPGSAAIVASTAAASGLSPGASRPAAATSATVEVARSTSLVLPPAADLSSPPGASAWKRKRQHSFSADPRSPCAAAPAEDAPGSPAAAIAAPVPTSPVPQVAAALTSPAAKKPRIDDEKGCDASASGPSDHQPAASSHSQLSSLELAGADWDPESDTKHVKPEK